MDLINVGYISGFHGLKGEVKIKSTTDFAADRFKVGNKLYLNKDDELIEVTIKSQREHKNINLVSFEGMESLNDVEKYKGYSLKVTKDMLFDLEEDEFYHFDLIGLDVLTNTGESLGKVSSIMETGANDIFVIKTKEQEILIPFVTAIVDRVDLDKKTITLFDVEGLW